MNIGLLEQKVEDKGLKFKFLAEKLGISQGAFIRKRNGDIPWKVSEINILTEMLSLTVSERDDIFGLESPK